MALCPQPVQDTCDPALRYYEHLSIVVLVLQLVPLRSWLSIINCVHVAGRNIWFKTPLWGDRVNEKNLTMNPGYCWSVFGSGGGA